MSRHFSHFRRRWGLELVSYALFRRPVERWKGRTTFNGLEGLHDFAEYMGLLREQHSKFRTWPEQRRRERECQDPDQQLAQLFFSRRKP
jgi:hypothetical protein